MSHGSPDWGAFDVLSTIYRVTDLGELAARLNVVNTYDRRGNVVWWDDFEDNINKWSQSTVGVGAAAALSTDYSRSGAKSAKLTTGNVINNITSLYRYQGLPSQNTLIGLEASFLIETAALMAISLYYDDGATQYGGSIRYNPSTQKLQYLTTGLAWADLYTGLVLEIGHAWHTVKIVADVSGSGEYVRALINNRSFDMSGLALITGASAGTEYCYAAISATALAAANRNIYFDDVIITQNEP